MAEQNNTTCAICGKGYYLCISCKSHQLTPWKIHTDTSEHYKIFQILRGVTIGVYTIAEAKKKLSNVDLSDMETFTDRIKERIQNILDYQDEVNSENIAEVKTTVKRARKKKSTQVVETE